MCQKYKGNCMYKRYLQNVSKDFSGRVSVGMLYHYYCNGAVAAIHSVKWDYMWENAIAEWNGTCAAAAVPYNKHVIFMKNLKE